MLIPNCVCMYREVPRSSPPHASISWYFLNPISFEAVVYGMQTQTYTPSYKDSITVINATTVIGQGFSSQIPSYTYTDLPGSSSEGVKCLTSVVQVSYCIDLKVVWSLLETTKPYLHADHSLACQLISIDGRAQLP